MKSGKVLLGALAGVAIGAVVGVLLAPEKGADTRKKISKKSQDLADDMKSQVSGLKDKYNDLVEKVENKVDSFANKGGDLVDNAKNELKGAANDFKSAAQGQGNQR
ncbi:YtxH domain-containing protein [Flavobacterium ardleyense]|uniref:YtxH domain-containing protein n=1 Tax=Flavobacterium ardleyense TaxID=2038737 RepID=UPI00298CD524|nr:YtxH domain-containing protein [Flavobacterium ardleyense]